MDPIESGVVEACQEFISRQKELLPLLAAELEVPEEKVFHTWALRRAKQRGHIKGTDWDYYPHGFECDLKNTKDGRYLRIDFGPRGRIGILSFWGVLQFIMTSAPPWREFPELKAYFAKGDSPYDQYSGDSSKMSQVWDRLESKGFFAKADPGLVALEAKYRTRGADGLTYVNYPLEISDETRVDCSVAHRQVFAPVGIQHLNGVNGEMSEPSKCLEPLPPESTTLEVQV